MQHGQHISVTQIMLRAKYIFERPHSRGLLFRHGRLCGGEQVSHLNPGGLLQQILVCMQALDDLSWLCLCQSCCWTQCGNKTLRKKNPIMDVDTVQLSKKRYYNTNLATADRLFRPSSAAGAVGAAFVPGWFQTAQCRWSGNPAQSDHPNR